MRVAFYTRVSTAEQTTNNQWRELEAAGEHRGWTVVGRFSDDGISGAKGRDRRPGYDALLTAVERCEVDLVAAWALDRVGRSLAELLDFAETLRVSKVGLYLHKQALDTTTPAGRMMFSMLGAVAEFERDMIRERVTAGLARAKAQGKKLGRAPASQDRLEEVKQRLLRGQSVVEVMEAVHIRKPTVLAVRAELAAMRGMSAYQGDAATR